MQGETALLFCFYLRRMQMRLKHLPTWDLSKQTVKQSTKQSCKSSSKKKDEVQKIMDRILKKLKEGGNE